MKCFRFALVAAGWFMPFFAHALFAQSFLFQNQPEDRPKFGLRFMRPNFSGESELSILSGTYDLWFNVPMGRTRVNLVGALPFNVSSFEGSESASGIGNICLGAQARLGGSAGRNMDVSLGVFLPTTPQSDRFFNDAYFIGYLTNFHEFHRSFPDVLTIYGNFAYRYRQIKRGMFALEIGPQLLVPTGEATGEAELFGHYGLAGGFPFARVTFFAELLGNFIISEPTEDLAERFTHSLAAGAQMTDSRVRPGLFYVLPLDDEINNFLDGTLGLRVDVALP